MILLLMPSTLWIWKWITWLNYLALKMGEQQSLLNITRKQPLSEEATSPAPCIPPQQGTNRKRLGFVVFWGCWLLFFIYLFFLLCKSLHRTVVGWRKGTGWDARADLALMARRDLLGPCPKDKGCSARRAAEDSHLQAGFRLETGKHSTLMIRKGLA